MVSKSLFLHNLNLSCRLLDVGEFFTGVLRKPTQVLIFRSFRNFDWSVMILR